MCDRIKGFERFKTIDDPERGGLNKKESKRNDKNGQTRRCN